MKRGVREAELVEWLDHSPSLPESRRSLATDPRQRRRRHIRPGLAGLVLALVAFAGLAASYVAGAPLVELDERMAVALHSHANPPGTTVARVVTTLGGFPVIAGLTCLVVGLLLRRGLWQEAVLVVLALAGGQAVTAALKALFQRERPIFDDPVATAAWFSFPSGHAVTALAVYGAVVWIVAPRLRSRALRAADIAGAGLLVAAIGFTRLYLGLHYLSDVLAGWSIGLAWLLVAAALVRAPWRHPRTGGADAQAPAVEA